MTELTPFASTDFSERTRRIFSRENGQEETESSFLDLKYLLRRAEEEALASRSADERAAVCHSRLRSLYLARALAIMAWYDGMSD